MARQRRRQTSDNGSWAAGRGVSQQRERILRLYRTGQISARERDQRLRALR